MLYEDDVVDAVLGHLFEDGWTITRFAHAHQHGDDIVASRGDELLVVEAKGEGSSKSHTARFGRPFTRQQASKHVAVAVLRALRVHSEGGAAAIALPATTFHQEALWQVWPALQRLGITVFWVNTDRQVIVQE